MKEKYYFSRSNALNLILIYFSMSSHFLQASSFQAFDTSDVKNNNSLAQCICEVSKRELSWKPTTVLKIEGNQTQVKEEFIRDLTELLVIDKLPYHVFSESILNETFDADHLFVDYIDNSDALLDFDFYAIQKKIKYLFILENYSEKFRSGDLEIIGSRVGNKDVTFLLKTSEIEYTMLTFIPSIDERTCKETHNKSYEINTCKDGYLTTNVIFPQKQPSDLMQCPLKIGLAAFYPFSTIDNSASLKTFDSLDGVAIRGMDVDIIKIIANYFNAKLQFHYIFKSVENPFIYNDFLPFLLNGSLDVLTGGLYRMYGDIVEYSGVYARQGVVWIYTADRLATTWQNLIVKIDGLYLFIVFYFAYSVSWYIIRVFDKHSVSFRATLLSSWGALIGTASLQDARTIKQKILNFVYLIMCLHLSVYISIQFYSFLTISGPPEILKTNEEIMNSGRKPYLHALTKYFVTEEKYIRFANTSGDCDSFTDCTEKVLKYNGLTAILEGYFYDFQAATIVNDEARLLKTTDNILLVYYEMIIGKHALAVTIQEVVARLFEAGITVKLFDEAIGISKMHKIKSATRNIVFNSYSCEDGCSITLRQISGIFYLWAIGCGLSCAVFAIELLFKNGRRNIERTNRAGLKVEKIL